ncbi:MAG: hypothetical protein KatS3mg044_0524 [Rhodothermaceae bacterium]|nr:MAG: acyltransferase [Bacteroidota bacterium]GIV61658.1 MAG: hypothetical protein KatS3mg044_0524 [Rhodothermaceae bacterium]
MDLPRLGPEVPQRGNAFTRGLGRTVLRLMGWRIEGTPPNLPRFVVIGGPHTTNWDFVVAMAAAFALDLDVHWLGKHTLFRGPFDRLFRWMGGIPVDRSRGQGVVEAAVAAFRTRERFVLGLSPEGTRRRVERWKTGFYRIASGAGVPIVPVILDYSRKAVVITPVFHPTADLAVDMAALQERYAPEQARYPDRYGSVQPAV